MRDSCRLFLAACSRDNKKIPYQNFKRSVLQGVSPKDHPLVEELGYTRPVSVWGIAKSFESNHSALTEGQDYVLFYTKKRIYTHAARLHKKAISDDLARDVWERKDERQLNRDPEEERSLLMFFTDVFRVDIPAPDLHKLLNYDIDYLLGGSKMPRESRLAGLRSKFGSVPAYVESFRNGPRRESPTSVEARVVELLEQTISDPELSTDEPQRSKREEIIRSQAFRKATRSAYDEACAMCGSSRMSPHGTPEVEAAHIYPKGTGGPDIVQNGVALCKLHHWAFDRGWIALSDDYTTTVRDAPNFSGYHEFKQMEGTQISLPEPHLQPHTAFLKAHRQFHGFEDSS
ncbi:HNH endonuclease [Salinigranum marinum]|uniref:HNH endonuclease n=1 Tax=Salinigranum marinum TaxID=1515595 RepID=UPI002989FCE9|nr:HNH endonuclease [Salinigranum marinum]